MKGFAVIFVFIISFLLLTGCLTNDSQNQPVITPLKTQVPLTSIPIPVQTTLTPPPPYQPVRYENQEMGFAIDYDKGWTYSYGKLYFGETKFTSPSGESWVTVSKWPYYSNPPPIEEVVRDYSDLKELPNATLTGSGITKISGHPAGYITYETVVGNTVFKHLEYLVQADNTLYVITYTSERTSYDRYESLFKQMVSSFEAI